MSKRIPTLTMLFACACQLGASVGEEALRLRNISLAELENEQPARAEEILNRLVEAVPEDPLPYANMAIAVLRQQRFDEALQWIERGLEKSPGQAELLAIKGEVLQWSGETDSALRIFEQAAKAGPDNVEIQYALLRQASTLSTPEAEAAARQALENLRRLRPENMVVLMQSGQKLLAAGDRSGATEVFQRIEEILWQAPAAAMTLLEQILAALEANDLEAARVPALRMENVAKITPMFKEGLRELSPGVQGVPLTRFRDEPAALAFGDPVETSFVSRSLASDPTTPGGLTTGDFNGDQRADWARLTTADGGALEIWLAGGEDRPQRIPETRGLERLLTIDLDNDGFLDLIAYGANRIEVFRGAGDGTFTAAADDFGLGSVGATTMVALDFDIEGDLDLVAAGAAKVLPRLYRNALKGPLEEVGEKVFPPLELPDIHHVVASDLDRDGDIDLLLAHTEGLTWLDNLRQGQFSDRSQSAGLDRLTGVRAIASADFDNDGLPDLALAGDGIRLLHNRNGRFEPWEAGTGIGSASHYSTVVALDLDNDGRRDLAVGGEGGVTFARQTADGRFESIVVEKQSGTAHTLVALDLDQDCDLDLLVGGGGLWQFENRGNDENHCLMVRLQGLTTGNSKNNFFGLGSVLELRSGNAYQFHEVAQDVTHLALGSRPKADLLRVVWTNGVPQNRLQPQAEQRIVEEQVLKGSCPFVYARQEDGIQFVTDLLWGAPIGLPVAPGIWATTDPQELVEIPGAVPVDGRYDLRITEELWEAAFFDLVRLWIVDHPTEVQVDSSLRILPGELTPDRVLGTREVMPVKAWDDRQADVSAAVASRDEIYTSPWRRSPYQGVAAEPWTLSLDLGRAPGTSIRLLFDSWIFPTDASLNLALAQQSELAAMPPRLEVETDSGWQVLMPSMGFPAGKTKTMVVDTPALPAGSHRLRIVGSQWLSFDRIVWSTHPADAEPVVRARLEPDRADLRFRGFSRRYRPAPNGPHYFDFDDVRSESPWLPFPGRYTRFGDVRELLVTADDRSVVMAPGDEIVLEFDASSLPAPLPGWQRTVFLESHGWDKDADRNTGGGQQVEPLPFRAMSTYPYDAGEKFPETPLHRDYLEKWLTREVTAVQEPAHAPAP